MTRNQNSADTSHHEQLFGELVRIIHKLRRECPWDREQTVESLKGSLLEEVHEALAAIDDQDMKALAEELGDILLLVMMITQICEDEGFFDLSQVIGTLRDKLIRRHPHIFDDSQAASPDEVLAQWRSIKRQEKGELTGNVLKGVSRALPALRRAFLLQAAASQVGFDWESEEGVWSKLDEEAHELASATESGQKREELGDLLFLVAHLGNFWQIDPEKALHRCCDKFERRFQEIERRLAQQGRTPHEASFEEMDRLWDDAKESEHHPTTQPSEAPPQTDEV
jgi:tetrapyrrole methylase family protein/MazG family protein